MAIRVVRLIDGTIDLKCCIKNYNSLVCFRYTITKDVFSSAFLAIIVPRLHGLITLACIAN